MTTINDDFATGSDQGLGVRTNWHSVYGGNVALTAFASTNSAGFADPPTVEAQFTRSDATFTGDLYIQFKITGLPAGSTTSKIGMTPWSTTGGNYMDCFLQDLDNTGNYTLTLNDNQGHFQSWGSQTLSVNDTVRCEIVGTTLSFKVNGSTTHTLDLSLTTRNGNYVGLYAYNATSSNGLRISLFEAGDITSGGTSIPRIMSVNNKFIVSNNRFMLS